MAGFLSLSTNGFTTMVLITGGGVTLTEGARCPGEVLTTAMVTTPAEVVGGSVPAVSAEPLVAEPYNCNQPNALQTEQSFGLSGLHPIQPRFSRIEAGLPRTKASSHHRIAHQLLNLQPYIHYYKPSSK
jgi:hypothetical protein